MRKIGERFERNTSHVDLIADFGKCLKCTRIIISIEIFTQTTVNDRAGRIDIMPGVNETTSYTQCAPLVATINTQVPIVSFR